ncbi:MAG: antirestriction protein ArdA [Pseudomonadota bacterium]
MTLLHAQPYDITATGFYFEDEEAFHAKMKDARNNCGDPVEEFEIQFIDGEAIDAALCEAIGLHQGNVGKVLELIDTLHEYDKQCLIIACGECRHSFDPCTDDVADYDIDIYEMDSMRELAEYFVDEGLFGEVPEHLANYIDYDAIARDLAVDYSETEIAGQRLIYACG